MTSEQFHDSGPTSIEPFVRGIHERWEAGDDIENDLRPLSDTDGDILQRFNRQRHIATNNNAYFLCWKVPVSVNDILRNIQLARLFIRVDSDKAHANLEKGVCFVFDDTTEWASFDKTILSLSKRESNIRPLHTEGSVIVAVSYKHDAPYHAGGTMSDERTRKELFHKVKCFYELWETPISLWIDQGLGRDADGTWYERGILPYAAFPVLFCSEWRGSDVTDHSPWLKIEAYMALHGQGFWFSNNAQQWWETLLYPQESSAQLAHPHVNCIKHPIQQSPGLSLLQVLGRNLIDGSICPNDYRYRRDFEGFMLWAAMRLVLCRARPVISTLHEDGVPNVGRGLVFLALKEVLTNLAAHHVMPGSESIVQLPVVHPFNDSPVCQTTIMDASLDPFIRNMLGPGAFGANLPCRVVQLTDTTFDCVVVPEKSDPESVLPTSQVTGVIIRCRTDASVSSVLRISSDPQRTLFNQVMAMYNTPPSFPPIAVHNDEERPAWTGDWSVRHEDPRSMMKGAVDSVGCYLISTVLSGPPDETYAPLEVEIVRDRTVAKLSENALAHLSNAHGFHSLHEHSVRHIRSHVWQAEYIENDGNHAISTAECFACLVGVVPPEAIRASTADMRISLRAAMTARLLPSSLMVNDERVLSEGQVQFNCALPNEDLAIAGRLACLTMRSPYIGSLIFGMEGMLKCQLIVNGTVYERVRSLGDANDFSCMTLLKVSEQGQSVILRNPIIRDILFGFPTKTHGLRRIERSDNTEEHRLRYTLDRGLFSSLSHKNGARLFALSRCPIHVGPGGEIAVRDADYYVEFPVVCDCVSEDIACVIDEFRF